MKLNINIINVLVFFLILNQSYMIAQIDTKLDSLIKVNQNYLFEDTVKINLQIEIADLSMRSIPEKSLETINEAIRISIKINSPLHQAQAYRIKGRLLILQRNFKESINCFNQTLNIYEQLGLKEKVASQNALLGYLWSQTGDIKKAIEYYKAGMEIYKKLGMPAEQANCLGWMAQNFGSLSDTSTAIKLFTQAIEINKKSNNTQGLINNYNDMAIMYNTTGAYLNAIASSQNSLKLCEQNKDETSMANTLLNIGAIYYYIHDIPKFNEYSKRALQLFKKLGDSYNIAKTCINIGSAYKELKDYEQAYNFHIQAQEILEKFNDKNTLAICYGNLGEILNEQNKIIEAIAFHNKALNLYDADNDKTQIATTLYNLIIVYRNASDDMLKQIGIDRNTLNDTVKSMGLRALTLSKESLASFAQWHILKELSSIYEVEGDYRNAYATYSQFTKLRDSLSNDEVKLEINRKEIQYEFDKKEVTLLYEKQLTIEQLEKQKILSEKQRQDIKIKNQLIIISENKNEINHLAYLKEKAEKTEKEQQLLLSEKDKLLQASQLDILGNEKKIHLQHLASQKSTIGFLLAGLIVILLSSIIYYLWLQHRQSQKEAIIQSKFTQRLFESTEDERGRIARDLHDGLSHDLLTLKRTLASEGIHKDATTKIDHIINDVRQISRNLHPVMLESLGLKICLDTLCEHYMNSGSLFISHEINYNQNLSKSSELQVFRIIQEAITNIIKYAKADAAKLSIETNNKFTEISIQDNGIGFDVNTVLNSGKSFGLISIQQRSKAIGGIAQIISNQNGTLININLPNNIH